MNELSHTDAKKLFEKVKNVSGLDINEYRHAEKRSFTDCVFLEDDKGNKFILSENGNVFDFPCGIFNYIGDSEWGFICTNKFLVYQKNEGFVEHNLPEGYSFIFKQSPVDKLHDAYAKTGDEWMYSFNRYNDYRVDTQRFDDIAVIEKGGLKALFSLKSRKVIVDKIDGKIYTDRECTYESTQSPCDNEYRCYIVYFKDGERHERDL